MATKPVPVEELQNANTIDILNVIRQNAPQEYQELVPSLEGDDIKLEQLQQVGDVLYGHPAIANVFVNALVNRIAYVRVTSAQYYNRFSSLKKGYLQFGETVENVYVNITKAREFSVDKAEARELKRSLPDVRAAFHVINWKVQYPVTIQNDDLRQAFMSWGGVEDLIKRIIDAVYTAAEYDEYLLFKYLIIKAVAKGQVYKVFFNGNLNNEAAVNFRGYSNKLTFMQTGFNNEGVHTVTPREQQHIFMDALYNARFDVNTLSSAFNMDKATYMGNLQLIDDFTTFDNDRFSTIVENTNMIETVTAAELAAMANVKAVIFDAEWFQVWDNRTNFTEKYVASGEYWNYFFNIYKTVSYSPFANAIAFIDNGTSATPTLTEFKAEVTSVTEGETGTIITLEPEFDGVQSTYVGFNFVQAEDATEAMVAVQKYGVFMFPANAAAIYPEITVAGTTYYAQSQLATTATLGSEITFKTTKPTPPSGS